MTGAGGTSGGTGQFFIGLAMMCGGIYMLLNSIVVHTNFGLGYRLYGFSFLGGNHSITSGMVIIPFIFGVGMVFYNGKSIAGWLLTLGSMTALIFGVIASLDFQFKTMTAFDLITILTLSFGGLGLFLRSLQSN